VPRIGTSASLSLRYGYTINKDLPPFNMGDLNMDKVSILCSKDKRMMEDFSTRCIDQLKHHAVFRIFSGLFSGYMDENVRKEIEKDRFIIENAARHFKSDCKLEDIDTHAIFEKTKEIDRTFLKKLSILPIFIDIRYNDIENIRIERIRLMSKVFYELLNNWKDAGTFEEIVKNTYTKVDFKEIIGLMLHLYNLETKMLSNFLILHHPASKISNLFVETLFNTMENIKDHLADEITSSIFE
jgi:hypothetical protein